jgi:hypothetical protein
VDQVQGRRTQVALVVHERHQAERLAVVVDPAAWEQASNGLAGELAVEVGGCVLAGAVIFWKMDRRAGVSPPRIWCGRLRGP